MLAAEDSALAGRTTSVGRLPPPSGAPRHLGPWCGPCKDESPDLVEFQSGHGGADFTVLGVQTQDGTNEGLEFVEEFGLD